MSLENKYLIKKDVSSEWVDVAAMFHGCRILAVSGFNERGKALNVYNEQWINSQAEDFIIPSAEDEETPVVIRENVDLQVTFIVSKKYTNKPIDVRRQHDAFVDYMTNSDVYIKSRYTNKEAHCICLAQYKPTVERLQRGIASSFIMGTITLHTLDMPAEIEDIPMSNNMYIGFGAGSIGRKDIQRLSDVQHYNADDPTGSYEIQCTETGYLWICFEGGITSVNNINVDYSFFYVPMKSPVIVGDYRCYRSANRIIPHTMKFRITT